MRKSALLAGIAILLTLFAMSGCSKDSSVKPAGPQAPCLPSVNTMTADLSMFESASIEAQYVRSGKIGEVSLASVDPARLNFLNAAVRALYLKTVVYAGAVLPVAAFSAAIHSVPQHQADDSWLWTYIFVNETTQYDVLLNGKQMDGYVQWRMVVSDNDTSMALDHFLWFDGQVQNDRKSGYWQFYEPVVPGTNVGAASAAAAVETPTPGVPCIRVDWQNNSWTDRQLSFLVNKVGAPAEGSTLTFSESLTQCSIVFYNSIDQSTGTIIWYPDGSGSIECPDYNGGVKGCWNALKLDIACD